MSLKVKACCFCLPLRIGLMIWGYLGLIINYVNILFVIYTIISILDGSVHFESTSTEFIKMTLLFGWLIIQFIFYIILVAGLHRKSRGLLNIFYDFNIIMMIILATLSALYIPLRAYKMYLNFDHWIFELIINLGIAVISLMLQFYLTIGVRSFLSVLKDEKDCSSPVHQTEDEECILHTYNPNKLFS